MMNDLITIGCSTATGGKVIGGSSTVLVNGQPIAAVGDIATCASGRKSCKGQGPIISVDPRAATLPGGKVPAKQGDKVDCNCGDNILLPSSHQISLGTTMTTSVTIGEGVSIGNGVIINSGGV